MATYHEDLLAVGLPVISSPADTNEGRADFGPMTEEQNELKNRITLQRFSPAVYQEVLDFEADKLALKNEYQAAITRLQAIENAGAIPFTQNGFNQVVAAVKDIAKILRILMKVLARYV